MIKCALFDMDGVLADATKLHFDAFNDALSKFGYEAIDPIEHHRKYNGLPTKTKIEKLSKDEKYKGIEKFKDSINQEKQKNTISLIDKIIMPNSEVTNCVNLCKKNGIITVCVTNSIKATTIKILSKVGIIDLIDLIVSNEDPAFPKPNPSPYLYAMSKVGVSPADCVAFEDSDTGIKAAKDACIGTIIKINPNRLITKQDYSNIWK